MRGTTKPFLVTESGMPATRSNIAGTATSEGAADVSQRPAAPTLGDVRLRPVRISQSPNAVPASMM
jgi:hypothetical protein